QDAAVGNGTEDRLHWMVWNIPATARALPEGLAPGSHLPDGARQISATGPAYRGPAAQPTDPAHHYVFELYALNANLDLPDTSGRDELLAAMAGKIVAKAAYVGRFKGAE
ncbi:MAG TPA: YbhB/YbcL family Raf kinase inhibitor-like protein, partial [Gammaproteobacteria bacterium]|nr:YbhB/YbcL family Raf kinase inhibitor-like protein [Gammaproteobacteria bacterium]